MGMWRTLLILLLLDRAACQVYGFFMADEPADPNSKVVTLTDDNFHAEVISKGEPMFVQFYAPWCGHCRRLMPTWDALAKELEGETRFGRVDCMPNEKLKDKYQIRGFPTLKLFIHGRSHEFQGMRTTETLKAFLDTHKAYRSKQDKPVKHTLYYFPWRGAAEVIRLTLKDLGIPFDEVRFTEDEWNAKKDELESSGVIPYGQLPALTVGDRAISSTGAILRYLADKNDMYGSAEDRHGIVDVLLDDVQAFYEEYSAIVHQADPQRYEAEKQMWTNKAADWLGYFNEQLKMSRELYAMEEPANYFAGQVASVADIAVFSAVQFALGMFPNCLDASPELKEWFRRIGTRDNINDYLSSPLRLLDMNGPTAQFGNKAHPEDGAANPFRSHV